LTKPKNKYDTSLVCQILSFLNIAHFSGHNETKTFRVIFHSEGDTTDKLHKTRDRLYP